MEHVRVEDERRCRGRHAGRRRAPQRDDGADGRRDRRDVRRARSATARPRRSSSPASRPPSARAPTSRASARSPAPRPTRNAAPSPSIYEGFLRVLRSPLPTIAAVNGPAVGAGMNLALACDVRLAGASARFDTRFVKIGLHPGGGHVWMLERAVGPQAAAAMVLFGVPGRRRPRRRDRARVVVPSRRRAPRRGPHASPHAPPALPSRSSTRQGHAAPGTVAARLRSRDRNRGHPPGVVARPGLVPTPT